MNGIQNLSRRDFLKNSGITGAMVLGAQVLPSSLVASARAQSTGASIQPNLFVSIADDGMVTITCSRSEMGQGVRTGIPMILADELEADWQRVKIWQAPGDAEKYDPAGKDGQNTDGSRSTRHHLDIMRELGAAGRYVLEQAAARKWGVDPGEVYAKDHRIFTTPPRAVLRLRRGGGRGGRHRRADRRGRPEAQGPVAVEVHRPRHAGRRQLRHEHRGRRLRCRRDHARHEDRGGGARVRSIAAR